jgi:hypothetical protein
MYSTFFWVESVKNLLILLNLKFYKFKNLFIKLFSNLYFKKNQNLKISLNFFHLLDKK